MLTTLKRKSYQRRINAAVRKMNKQLAEDDFLRQYCDVYIRQETAHFYRYEDKSGAGMNVRLCITDKVTGAQARQCFAYYRFEWGWDFWCWVNDFVCDLRRKGQW